MGNGKPENVMCEISQSCGHICRLQFTFERQEELLAVGDLREGFFH